MPTLMTTFASDKPYNQQASDMPTQLYAKIKKSSKYFSQNDIAREAGEFPFPVEVYPDGSSGGGYCIKGGPGGQYTAKDVNLYAVVDGIQIKLS